MRFACSHRHVLVQRQRRSWINFLFRACELGCHLPRSTPGSPKAKKRYSNDGKEPLTCQKFSVFCSTTQSMVIHPLTRELIFQSSIIIPVGKPLQVPK